MKKIELDKLKKCGITVIDGSDVLVEYGTPEFTKRKQKMLRAKLVEMVKENVVGYCDEPDVDQWALGTLSYLFAKLPKGFFGNDQFKMQQLRKTWTWKDRFKVFIFKKL